MSWRLGEMVPDEDKMDLSQDEFTVLAIAAEGESMLAIGHWKQPTESLVARGYLRPTPSSGDPTGTSNYRITEEGRKAFKDAEDAPYKAMTETGNRIGAAQKQIRDFAEAAAQLLAACAKASSVVTGDAPEYAAEKWIKVILERTREVLRG